MKTASKERARWSYKKLVEFVGGDSITITSNRLGISPSQLHRWRTDNRHFTDMMADRHACRIGCHPWEIWDDWFD